MGGSFSELIPDTQNLSRLASRKLFESAATPPRGTESQSVLHLYIYQKWVLQESLQRLVSLLIKPVEAVSRRAEVYDWSISLKALTKVLPIEKVWAFDRDPHQIQRFIEAFQEVPGFDIEAAGDLETAIRHSDVCVTCTPSKQPFLKAGFVTPGAFIAAVGADNPEKQELESSLLRGNKLVVDVLEQCATIGELHHALDAGLITSADVYGELGEVIDGIKQGCTSADEIIIFDSTGMAFAGCGNRSSSI